MRADPGPAASVVPDPGPVPSGTAPRYRERLVPPLRWWVLAALFAFSMLLAFGLYLGPVWGIGMTLLSLAGAAVVLGSASTEVTVTEARFTAGRASIELTYLGEVEPLDPERARRRRGPEADARAYLMLRPYVPTAIAVAVTDVDDPAPYWLVSTRRPQALATALRAAIAGAGQS